MTTEEIKEGNKLIEIFRNRSYTIDDNNFIHWNDEMGSIIHASVLKYHESWNDLLPVVEKITKLTPRKGAVLLHTTMYEPIISALMEIDIIKVFQATSCYIKWLNSQPKQSE